jgi:hypothetical protein
LGTRERNKKFLPLLEKEKNWTIHECTVSLAKTVRNHFLPGLITLPKSGWGTYFTF